MTNKKGMTQIQQIGVGSLIGVMSIIIMSFGSASSNIWLLRGGIVGLTFASWLISWK